MSRTERLDNDIKEMKKQMALLMRSKNLHDKVALRFLLADIREKAMGRPLTAAEQGPWWNSHYPTLHLAGLPQHLLSHTAYELTGQQDWGNDVALQVDLSLVYEAVMSHAQSADYEQLFKWKYPRYQNEVSTAERFVNVKLAHCITSQGIAWHSHGCVWHGSAWRCMGCMRSRAQQVSMLSRLSICHMTLCLKYEICRRYEFAPCLGDITTLRIC